MSWAEVEECGITGGKRVVGCVRSGSVCRMENTLRLFVCTDQCTFRISSFEEDLKFQGSSKWH